MRIRSIGSVVIVAGACAAGMALVAAQGRTPPPSGPDPEVVARADTGIGQYFTAAQAVRGEALFNRHCGYCHNADPKNRPTITGTGGQPLAPRYIQKQTDGNPRYPSAYYLFRRMEYMPPNDVESVTPQQRADILAYVLRQNGLAPGNSELSPDYGKMQGMPLPEPGFVHVFNGRDFTGLQFLIGYHCTPQPEGCGKTDPTGIFSVKDGVLHTNGRIHGYTYTTKKYKDFTLRFEQRIALPWENDLEDLVQDQTGFMLFLGSKGAPVRAWGGYLLEVEGKYHELLSIYGATLKNITIERELRRRVINPANQWQRIDIVSKGGTLKCYLNNVLISTAELPPDVEAGYIAWQSQGGPVEWRNLRIREEQ